MSRMKKRADNGQLNPSKTGSSSSRTDFLIKWETVPKYYQAVLEAIITNVNPTKSIKEVGDEFKLKIQLGKYAHPLYVSDDGTAYRTATFDTHEEALEAFADFNMDLTDGVIEVVNAVKPAWERYANKNGIKFEEDSS